MAERKAAEDKFNPRHRIVGAVILVALAVIFLPMLLSERPAENGSSATPSTRTVVMPVPPPGDKTAGISRLAESGPAPEKPGTQSQTVIVPVEPVTQRPSTASAPSMPEPPSPEVKPVPEPKPAAETKTAKAVAPAEKGWLVQVGAFSQPENARRLQDKLRQKGYSAMLDPPKPEKGKTVRVEVGPYKDADAAKAAQARIQSEIGIKGVVRKQ